MLDDVLRSRKFHILVAIAGFYLAWQVWLTLAAPQKIAGLAGASEKVNVLVTLPFPRAVMMNGERLPASYANFYIGNGFVAVPTFNDPNDRVALATLAELMPGREVVGIHAVDLVWGLGTLHCMTQQQPAGMG